MSKKKINTAIDSDLYKRMVDSDFTQSYCIERGLELFFDSDRPAESEPSDLVQNYEARIQELKDSIDRLENDKQQLYNQIQNKDFQLNSLHRQVNIIEAEQEKPRLVDRLKFWKWELIIEVFKYSLTAMKFFTWAETLISRCYNGG